MKLRVPTALVSSALTGLVVMGVAALAAPPGVINSYVGLCNPLFPTQCAQIDSSGNVPITGSISVSATTTATATASDPSYSEGQDAPISQDLSGHLRVGGSFTATTAATATAAAPSYSEGVSEPISQDLSGNLRTIAQQSGTWNITNVSGTVSLPTGASTAAKQPALGTAGTASSDVLTVQGIASMTPLAVSASSLPLPSGAATAANQSTEITALGTINTTLGSPFQAGGSIGNTSFAATQATAANLNATVVGTGTFAVQATGVGVSFGSDGVTNTATGAQVYSRPSWYNGSTWDRAKGDATDGLLVNLGSNNDVSAAQSGTWNITNVSGTVSLPTGASTASNQTDGSQKTQIVDGSGNVISSTSNNLNVQCANCSGSGASATDEATFTAGADVFAPSGGFYQTTPTNNALTNGQQGMQQFTAQRAGFVNLRNASGTEIGTASTPVQVSVANTGANSTAIKVDGSAVTQPVSAASLPLPTGASTAAKQPALGTAGSASTDVLTVQGIASMTPLLVDGSGSTQPVSGTVAVTQGTASNLNATVVGTGTFQVQCSSGCSGGTQYNIGDVAGATDAGTVPLVIRDDALSTLSDAEGDWVGERVDSTGALWSHVTSVDGTVTVDNGGTFAVQAAQSGTWNINNVSGTVSLPTGAATAAKQPALGTAGTASSDVITVQGIASMTPLLVDGSGSTQPVSGTVAVTQGTASNLNATVVGTGTFAVQCTSGCSSSASAFGSTFPTDGNAIGASDGTDMQPLLVDGSGNLKVAQQGDVNVTNSGTFATQAAQSGTWNITNVSGTVSLPTGASTASNQTAVQGSASGGSAASNSQLAGGIYNSTPPTLTNGQQASLQLDSAGGLKTTSTVSGTVAATQSGTWNITNVSGTVSLPTGASTAAKQPALGTAGSASSDVITVQGIASMTALKVDGSGVTQPVSGTVAATQSGSWSLAANQSVNVAQMNGVATTMGNGASGTGVQRVTIASDSTGNIATIGTSVTPGTAAANLGKAEDAAHSSGDTGVFALGVRNDALSAFSSADGDYTPIAVESTGRVVTGLAPSAALVKGTATTTGTSDTSLVAAAGAGLKNYITSCQLVNTGSTTALITFKDGSGGSTLVYTVAPTGGGSNIVFPAPFATTANTALYFAAGSSSTTIYASCQGYKAP